MNCQTLIEKFVNDRDETIVNQLGQRMSIKKSLFFFSYSNFIDFSFNNERINSSRFYC